MRLRGVRRHQEHIALAQQAFGPGLVLSGGEAGLHLVMWLPDELSDREVAQRAAQMGLGVRALSAYARPPVRSNGLVLGYGNLDEGAVKGAVARLRQAVGAVGG